MVVVGVVAGMTTEPATVVVVVAIAARAADGEDDFPFRRTRKRRAPPSTNTATPMAIIRVDLLLVMAGSPNVVDGRYGSGTAGLLVVPSLHERWDSAQGLDAEVVGVAYVESKASEQIPHQGEDRAEREG